MQLWLHLLDLFLVNCAVFNICASSPGTLGDYRATLFGYLIGLVGDVVPLRNNIVLLISHCVFQSADLAVHQAFAFHTECVQKILDLSFGELWDV